MSGGHFNYNALHNISEEIARLIRDNAMGYKFSNETIAEFRKTLALLGDCYERIHEIEYLVSAATTSEEGFLNAMKRLEFFNVIP